MDGLYNGKSSKKMDDAREYPNFRKLPFPKTIGTGSAVPHFQTKPCEWLVLGGSSLDHPCYQWGKISSRLSLSRDSCEVLTVHKSSLFKPHLWLDNMRNTFVYFTNRNCVKGGPTKISRQIRLNPLNSFDIPWNPMVRWVLSWSSHVATGEWPWSVPDPSVIPPWNPVVWWP